MTRVNDINKNSTVKATGQFIRSILLFNMSSQSWILQSTMINRKCSDQTAQMWRLILVSLIYIWCAMHEKGPCSSCRQWRPLSACVFAQADQGLQCQLTESMDTVVYMDEQRMPKSDCAEAHDHLDLCCLHIACRPFSHVVHHKV